MELNTIIPTPILSYIFQYFPIAALLRLRIVCRKWNDIIQQSPVEIDSYNFRSEREHIKRGYYSIYSAINLFFNTFKFIEKLNLNDVNKEQRERFCRCVLNSLPNPQNVKYLSLGSYDEISISRFLNLENLR
jgi:hypothetical protein